MKIQSIILPILLCGVILSSCSKKMESNEVSQEAAPIAADMANERPEKLEPDTTPATEQKPEVILNTQVSDAESTRRMVREASVNFTAQDVIKTTLAIDKMTFEAGGFVEKKNIDFNVTAIQTQKITDGKIKVFEKVDPVALMTVRIPSEKAAIYVNQLLPLMHFLNQQQYSAKHYELKLLEEKIDQSQVVPSPTRNPQLSEISRLTQLEVQDRVRFSTIHIYINQPSTIRERIDVDVNDVARLNGDSFWVRAWNGIQQGWHFILDFVVILITIWPIYFILCIAYLVYQLICRLLKKIK